MILELIFESKAKEKRRLATEAKRDIERETAAREAEKIPDHKSEELLKLKSYLNELNLEIEEMAPDGDCLFAAIAHQLSLRDTTSAEVIRVDDVGLDDPKLDKNTLEYDAKKLRVIASNWLRQNADHYEMFLDAEEAGSNSIIEYCDRMCKPGEIWGGHLEIDALSAALNSPIIIYQADQSLIKFNENSPTAPIRIW